MNLGPTDYESAALTAELRAPHGYTILQSKDLIDKSPPASRTVVFEQSYVPHTTEAFSALRVSPHNVIAVLGKVTGFEEAV